MDHQLCEWAVREIWQTDLADRVRDVLHYESGGRDDLHAGGAALAGDQPRHLAILLVCPQMAQAGIRRGMVPGQGHLSHGGGLKLAHTARKILQ